MPRLLPAGFVERCQPSSVQIPPAAADWLHEIKHDGFRLMVRREAGRVRLFTRNGHDWAARYPAIVAAAAVLQARSFLIDGEAVIADARGVASFNLLRRRARDTRAFLWAFDLLALDGEDLRNLPLEGRKGELKLLLNRMPYRFLQNASIGLNQAHDRPHRREPLRSTRFSLAVTE